MPEENPKDRKESNESQRPEPEPQIASGLAEPQTEDSLPEDFIHDSDPPEPLRHHMREVVRQIRPNTDEEDQTEAVLAASQMLKTVDAGARFDQASLAMPDAVDECNQYIRRGNYPTENYPSNTAYYGFTTGHQGNDTIYSQEKLDGFLLKMEDWFYRVRDKGSWFSKPIRTKIYGPDHAECIMDRAKELGLEQYFSINDQGQLVEQNEDIRQGIMLDDLLRFHQREEDEYQFLKGFEAQISHALALTAEAVHAIHQQSGSGIGEVLANDIVLKVEEGQIVGARITLPDVAYRNEVEPLEQQATDLADLCFSLGSAGFQVGGEELARAHIQTVLENYDNDFVKTALKALVETRPHYGFITNRPRLGFDRVKNPKQTFEQVRAIVLETLNEKPSLPS